MRNVFCAVALALCCAVASAQQSIFQGEAPVVSPEIHQDQTVTFRLKAPAASKVQLTGDCVPPGTIDTPAGKIEVTGTVDMQRDSNGVWTYTTTALLPELYYYWFIVDGVKVNDPQNAFVIRDVNNVMSVLLTGTPDDNVYLVGDVPHGTVSKVWYHSPAAAMKRRLTVYTPPGYETSGRSYPVLYLLHGMGGDEQAWMELGRTSQILDNLIAQRKAEPMIVVMPNGNISQEAAPGEKAGVFAQPTTALPKTMDGHYEQAFPDIVKFVESTFRVVADKQHRAIAGLSMGGFHSFYISANHPDWFNYVGLFSAAISHSRKGGVEDIYADTDAKLAKLFAQPPRLYWIAIGKDDFLYADNQRLRQRLDAQGYRYEYRESAGGHIWRNWRIYLTEFAQRLFK